MKLIVLFLSLLISTNSIAVNYGHRLGGDYYKDLPENTLEILERSLDELQYHEKFKYFEFDVRETKDNKLIVFHDKDTERMTGRYKKVKKAEYLRLEKDYLIWGEYLIPTVQQVLDELDKRAVKPILVEIKHLHSDKAKEELIRMVDALKGHKDINFLAFKKKFKKTFKEGTRKYWCSKLKVVKRVGMHSTNLCKPYLEK